MRPLLGALVVFCAMLGPQPVRAQIPHQPYEAFMSLDDGERVARFGQLAPENQAELQREHLARWRQLRSDSSTDEERKLLDEVADSIRAENYTPGRRANAEEVRAFMDRSQRVSALFTPEESSEAFTLRSRLH